MNPEKDRVAMYKIQHWRDRYKALDHEEQIQLTKFRWMLEEYRISLFSQPLGTSMSVSDKRLAKEWETVMGLRR